MIASVIDAKPRIYGDMMLRPGSATMLRDI
jgi:hypothetical protein